ncbi:hypothetical protein NCS52_01183600 [Fusarium sp. LHS14.1]|nr:hypothetical protein NCS52_01183600 [Fusarium sp. LHS14.1]
MNEGESSKGIDQFHHLLLCFQCQRIPLELISRACKQKQTWSAKGELEWSQPQENGVPQWLLEFWGTHQGLFDHDDGAAIPGLELRLVSDYSIHYLDTQVTTTDKLETDEQVQEVYTPQCVRIFVHAFPCRHTEVLGEEVAARLVPLAKAFLLPLFASISAEDVRDWILPEERNVEFAIHLFDCLQQLFAVLGPDSPLYPKSFPRKVLQALGTIRRRGLGTEACLGICVDMVDLLFSKSSAAFEQFILSEVPDERCNAWMGLSLVLLSSNQAMRKSQALSDAIKKATTNWRPISAAVASSMEYLVAVQLLHHSKLQAISLPVSPGMEFNILRGLLLSRMQYHGEAARVLHAGVPAAVSHWGLKSFQVGIIAAESANCYNMLRREDIANMIATRFLAGRGTPELTSRQDWFYLNFSLIDSLIGSGRYAEAEPAIKQIISQPSVPPTIHMMGCLRLSKIGRRAPEQNGTEVESHHPLEEGIDHFRQVSSTLREEYLEEVACSLSVRETGQKSLEAQETLVAAVGEVLGKTTLGESPAKKRYTQAQLDFRHHIFQQDDNPSASEWKVSRTFPVISSGQESQEKPESSTPGTTKAPMATRTVFSVPHERNHDFVQIPQATDILYPASLEDYFDVYAFYGGVGVGKTSFATDFAYRVQHVYSVVLWVKDAPVDEIRDYLSSVAAHFELVDAESSIPIHPDEALEQMFRWFTHPDHLDFKGPWLIVFDGIENEQVIRHFWPTGGQFGTVFVMSREKPSFLSEWANVVPRYIELGKSTTTEATESASHHTPTHQYPEPQSQRMAVTKAATQVTRSDTDRLLDMLNRQHDLAAIKQATALISKHHMSTQYFIAAYQRVQTSLLGPQAMDKILQYPNHSLPLITMWFLDSRDGESLMNVISLLSPTYIDETFLFPDQLFARIDNYPQIASDFQIQRDDLLDSSMIWRDSGSRRLNTSPVLHTAFREQMEPSAFNDAYCRALYLLSQAWPCKFEDPLLVSYAPSHHTRCSELWPHALSLKDQPCRLALDHLASQEAATIVPALLDISWCAILRFRRDDAHSFLDLADRILGVQISKPYVDMALHKSLLNHHKGSLACSERSYEDAIAYFHNSLIGIELRQYPFVEAAAYLGIGDVQQNQGNETGAINLYKRSVKALVGIQEDAVKPLADARTSLSLSLLSNRQLQAVETVLQQARLSSSAATLSAEILSSPRNAFVFFGLAIVRLSQTKVEDSLRFAQEALNMASSVFHVAGLNRRFLVGGSNLIISCCYGRLSDFDLALEHLKRARAVIFSFSPNMPQLGDLSEQRRLYDLMSQGRENLEVSPGFRDLFEGGFLNEQFFWTYLLSREF